MPLRVLSWNLMHGRSVPGAGRDLLDEFTTALAGWRWDVALLQEVPPWWPEPLGARLGVTSSAVLTSRNSAPALRRALAIRRPDLIRSGGGGANAILVRGEVAEHRVLRLTRWPERRWLHAVRLTGGGWIGNLHLTAGNEMRARPEADRAASVMLDWAGGARVVLGGDFNLRGLTLDGFALRGCSEIDYVFEAAGPLAGGPSEVLDAGRLSDHAPLLVTLATVEGPAWTGVG